MKWVGRAIRRLEDPALVTGRGRFTADLPATHWVRFVRSPVASGRILRVNVPDGAQIVLAENLARLHSLRDEQGRPFTIETLPMPPALVYDGTRLPASYANFYIVNGGIILPTFDCAADAIAIATLQRLFPGRQIVGLPATDLVWGLGAAHCLTQQHPA